MHRPPIMLSAAAAFMAALASSSLAMQSIIARDHQAGPGRRSVLSRHYRNRSKYVPLDEDRKHGLLDNLPPKGTDLR